MESMNKIEPDVPEDGLPAYEPPRITVMQDEEVLKAFQMTALEISAAGCWWAASNWA
jgi:hypothetical protein